MVHLGHRLYANIYNDDLGGVIASFYRQFNMFRSKFGKLASTVQAGLFNNYCTSFYGCLLLPFKKIDRLCVILRKSLRAVWRLPYRTHCGIVAALSSSCCGKHMFISRFMTFAKAILNHPTNVVSYVMRAALNCSLSLFRENVQYCSNELGLSSIYEINDNMKTSIRLLCTENCKSVLKHEAMTIRELCDVRDKLSQTILEPNEVQQLIFELSIN